MFFNRDLKAESETLARWLISIPSISGTRGESVMMQAIYDGLSGFPYFKTHPNNLHFVSHQDQKNSSILGLVKASMLTEDTLVLLCSIDSSGLNQYSIFKAHAFKSDTLKEQLTLHSRLPGNAGDDILLGLGSFENKGGTACMIAALKELSDHAAALECNILFVCMSCNLKNFAGIKTLLPYIADLIEQENLKLYAALSTAPQQKLTQRDDKLHIFTSNQAMLEPSFFILGEHDRGLPFSGFSAGLIASILTQQLELNAAPLRKLSDKPLTPRLTADEITSGLISPDCRQLSFKLYYNKLNIARLIDELKRLAASAVERAAELTDERATLHYYLNEQPYHPDIKDAEILSFSDLLERARKNYPGSLDPALETLKHNCIKEGLTEREILCCIIEKLNEFVNLPRPSVVIFLGPEYALRQGLIAQNREDRDKLMRLNDAVCQVNALCHSNFDLAEDARPGVASFLRPLGTDAALTELASENPLFADVLYNLGCPGITVSLKGGNLHQANEYIDCSMFRCVPALIFNLLNSISKHKNYLNLAAAHSAESSDQAASLAAPAASAVYAALTDSKNDPLQSAKILNAANEEQKQLQRLEAAYEASTPPEQEPAVAYLDKTHSGSAAPAKEESSEAAAQSKSAADSAQSAERSETQPASGSEVQSAEAASEQDHEPLSAPAAAEHRADTAAAAAVKDEAPAGDAADHATAQIVEAADEQTAEDKSAAAEEESEAADNTSEAFEPSSSNEATESASGAEPAEDDSDTAEDGTAAEPTDHAAEAETEVNANTAADADADADAEASPENPETAETPAVTAESNGQNAAEDELKEHAS
ncbi:MAG: hypothetical protein IAB19_09325 [Proteobacteria bacterium]|uniref:Uncharacterized protein n=1 Tax=Candidatus Avisuccinivibrio stercorigallinarum TaxID=2840704 RepID=A0A9D9DDR0_9GAMM|nr:hypothetical protein [Candidatus Avisuccinivibrio stercorigallinarum]